MHSNMHKRAHVQIHRHVKEISLSETQNQCNSAEGISQAKVKTTFLCLVSTALTSTG